jgi:hypothetical protein
MTITKEEATLKVLDLLVEILVSLIVDDSTTDAEVEAFETDMAEVASLMIDSLGLKVISVDNPEGTKFTATFDILESGLADEDN